jgi:hypothetical protein
VVPLGADLRESSPELQKQVGNRHRKGPENRESFKIVGELRPKYLQDATSRNDSMNNDGSQEDVAVLSRCHAVTTAFFANQICKLYSPATSTSLHDAEITNSAELKDACGSQNPVKAGAHSS